MIGNDVRVPFNRQVEAIGEFINNFGAGIIKWLVFLALLSIPVASIKYLFWG